MSDDPKIVYGPDDSRYHRMRANELEPRVVEPRVVERVTTVQSQRATVEKFLADAEAKRERRLAEPPSGLNEDMRVREQTAYVLAAIRDLREDAKTWPA